MEHYGMHMTPHDVYLNEGATGHDTVARISLRDRGYEATEKEIDDIYSYKARLFRSMPEAQVMPGAQDVFRKAAQAGLKILIVTGSGQKNLIERVQRDYEGYITRDLMVTAFEVKRGKPYPDPYLKGLQLAGVPASEAVVVENAPLGIRAAVAAGIDTIAVNTGPLEDEILLAEGPSLLLHSMHELSDRFDSLCQSSIDLSVIIPVYNTGLSLRPTLDCVLKQDMDSMEVIVVNDGSTDNSLSILEEYASKDSRVRVLSQSNGRQGKARNNGLSVARGNYIAFLDSDDLLSDNFYPLLYQAAVSTDSDIAYGPIRRIKKKRERLIHDFKESYVTDNIEEKLRICKCPPSFYCMNMIIRRSVIEGLNLRFPEGVYYEDAPFMFRLICGSGRMVTVPQAEYIYIHHTGSTVHSHQTPQKQNDKYNAHKEVIRIASEYGIKLPERFLNVTKRQYSLGPVCLVKITEKDGMETYRLFDFIPFWRRRSR